MPTAISCSSLNLVRYFPSALARPSAIGTFIDHWNDFPHLLTWPKDADEIFGKIQRPNLGLSSGTSGVVSAI